MNPSANRVFAEALSMSTDLRALLVSQLLETLDDHENKTQSGIDADVQQEHLAVVRKRLEEIKSGKAETISAEAAETRIRKILEA